MDANVVDFAALNLGMRLKSPGPVGENFPFMEDVAKHYRVLGLKAGCSAEELEVAYQDRAEAWNPENFAGNERLQAEAREKLGHINAAYEVLRARMGDDSIPAETAPSRDASPAPPAETAGKRRTVLWVLVLVLILLGVGAVLLLIWGTQW